MFNDNTYFITKQNKEIYLFITRYVLFSNAR